MTKLVDALTCGKCGAPLPMKTGEVLLACPYCGSVLRLGGAPFVLRHSLLRAAVIDRPAAEAVLRGWMAGGFVKPGDLARHSTITSLEAVYLPFFVFEVHASTRYAGLLTRTGGELRREGALVRDYFWKILGRRSGDFPVREYKLPLAHKIPFETAAMIAGAQFLHAEIDEVEAGTLAREQVMEQQRTLLHDVIDVVETADTEVTWKDPEFLHAPFWTGSYGYRDKSYAVILDAAAGEVVRGDIPPPTGGLGEMFFGR